MPDTGHRKNNTTEGCSNKLYKVTAKCLLKEVSPALAEQRLTGKCFSLVQQVTTCQEPPPQCAPAAWKKADI